MRTIPTALILARACVLAFLLLVVMPHTVYAASKPFEVSGWMPYWKSASSTSDVLPHLDQLTEVNPFVFSVKMDGTLVDNAPLNEEPWVSFIAAARQKKVRVIPTVMWSNRDAIHSILSNRSSRIALEDRITALAVQNGFDGIDIDFENKSADDKNYFSTFLKGLYMRMGKKWVMCSIEARTPIDSRYYGVDAPVDAQMYANDFSAINKYCDRVRIMAYDQQGIDLRLSAQAASSSQLYAPVADPAWVRKVIQLAKKNISARKLVIGIPTYGYEYNVTAYANNEYLYDILWTFNPGYALPLAAQYGVTPERNLAGEMFFTYTPRPDMSTATPPVSLGPHSALLAASAASMYASGYNSNLSFHMLDWNDAVAIAGKIGLARELGIRGVAIFKMDGGEDQNMWSVLELISK